MPFLFVSRLKWYTLRWPKALKDILNNMFSPQTIWIFYVPWRNPGNSTQVAQLVPATTPSRKSRTVGAIKLRDAWLQGTWTPGEGSWFSLICLCLGIFQMYLDMLNQLMVQVMTWCFRYLEHVVTLTWSHPLVNKHGPMKNPPWCKLPSLQGSLVVFELRVRLQFPKFDAEKDIPLTPSHWLFLL